MSNQDLLLVTTITLCLTRSNVPLPCVAASSTRTPTNKTHANMLADFTPAQPPMVPAVLIHCVKEIEDRGLHEVCSAF